jgi:hypothetical protein
VSCVCHSQPSSFSALVFQVGSFVSQLDILLYGGDGGGDLRPEFVPPDKWFIAAEFHPNANASVRSFL